METVTVEALIRSKDWVAGRDNALSTIFGIEGEFLVRVGDGDRPRDQVQVVAPGGNFPGPNVVPGLPVNEWVHIAIVYDATTRERLYYKDGYLYTVIMLLMQVYRYLEVVLLVVPMI